MLIHIASTYPQAPGPAWTHFGHFKGSLQELCRTAVAFGPGGTRHRLTSQLRGATRGVQATTPRSSDGFFHRKHHENHHEKQELDIFSKSKETHGMTGGS